jgi:hypothetical protein
MTAPLYISDTAPGIGLLGGTAVGAYFGGPPGAVIGGIAGLVLGQFFRTPPPSTAALAVTIAAGQTSQSLTLPLGKSATVYAPKGGKIVGMGEADAGSTIKSDVVSGVGSMTAMAGAGKTSTVQVDYQDSTGTARKAILYVTIPAAKEA